MLPESPQNRKWRHSREAAYERIEGYREELRALLDEADALLDAGTTTHSDLWFDLAARLATPATNVGAAIYCLLEWREPEDARPDVDDYSDPTTTTALTPRSEAVDALCAWVGATSSGERSCERPRSAIDAVLSVE